MIAGSEKECSRRSITASTQYPRLYSTTYEAAGSAGERGGIVFLVWELRVRWSREA